MGKLFWTGWKRKPRGANGKIIADNLKPAEVGTSPEKVVDKGNGEAGSTSDEKIIAQGVNNADGNQVTSEGRKVMRPEDF
jgi:hypothetical protein